MFEDDGEWIVLTPKQAIVDAAVKQLYELKNVTAEQHAFANPGHVLIVRFKDERLSLDCKTCDWQGDHVE